MPNPVINRRLYSAKGTGICAAATAWAARVVTNGGAKPSVATQMAICTYYNSLVAAGVDSLMIADLLFVPDNLTAAITPFFKTLGNDPWTNHNFVAGDLSTRGLTGNGTTKYLDSGVIDNAAWVSGTEFGEAYYFTLNDNNPVSMGSLDINNQNMGRIDANAALNSMSANCYDLSNVGTVFQFAFFGVPHAGGFMAGVRQDGTHADLYVGNSAVPFKSASSQAGQGAGRPLGFSQYCFAINLNGSPATFSPQTYQWAGIFRGLGMTFAKAQALFNAVQALQVTLGRQQ